MARKKTTLKADPEPIDEVKTIEAPEPEDGAILARALGLRGPQDDDHAIKTFRFITQAITAAGTGGVVTISTPAPVQSFYIPEKTFRHLDELEVAITVVQSGSGDPAPDNVRPITGWSEAKIYVQETVDPTAQPTATIDLDGTRYGCTLDVRRGKLTVTHKYWTSQGTEKTDWASGGGGGYYTQKNYGFDSWPYSDDGYCNMFIFKYSFRQTNGIMAYANRVQVSNSQFSTLDEFFDAITETPIQLVYPLATPIEVDLTPTTIDLLEGQNNIFCDTGDVTRLSYSYENMI